MVMWQILFAVLVTSEVKSADDLTGPELQSPRLNPIVGILAQELDESDTYAVNFTSFIAASYVKAVEASGARVTPIFIRRSISYYRDILGKVNGIVYPGGNVDLLASDGYGRAAKIILDIVIEMNTQGRIIPLLGICQGLEVLTLWTNNGTGVLTSCPVDNINLRLKFSPKASSSSLYRWADDEDINALAQLEVTSNHHFWCLTEKNITRFNLKNTWDVLTTSHYRDMVFVSSMEMSKSPVAAVQFHPEKTAYEWNIKQNNPHSRKAVKANRVFYDWLVDEARRNNNSFPSQQELLNSIIYNYVPIYTGKAGKYNEQVYYFLDPPRS